MALSDFSPSPGIIKPVFDPLKQRGSSANPPRSIWWWSNGQRKELPLTGELANATSWKNRNGSLVVNGPFGERVFGTATTTNATPSGKSPMGNEPPKFDVLRNVKDPEIDAAASAGLRGAQQSGAQAQNLFNEYLSEFQSRRAPSAARLAKETSTYDTAAADLDKALAQNLEQQRATLTKARDVNLQQLMAGDERYALSRGPLGASRSGEQERTFADAYYRAILPYEERIGALGRENIGAVNAARLSTAPLARQAESQYLSSLVTPAATASAIRSDELRNLGAAASLLQSNRFYTPYSDDPRLIPQLPTPTAGYQVPGVPNYSAIGSPSRPTVPTYRPPVGGSQFSQQYAPTGGRSQAEIDYQAQTGFYPIGDKYFNPELYQSLGGRVGQQRPAYNPLARQSEVEQAQYRAVAENDRRALADQQYQEWKGIDPNSDPQYDEDLWRMFYNAL